MFGLIGSALGAISGLFGSFMNASMQSVQNSKNIKYQMIENEKNRQYNSSEAALARNFSANFAREMYEKQYNDNSYSSQVAQMKAAGINPALAYSSGNFAGASMPSASSPSSSSSGSVSSQAAPQIDPSYMADIALKAAQIENINAQTKKTESETEGQGYTNEILKSDAKFREAYNSGVINLQNVSIDLGKSQKNLTDEQITKTRLDCKQLENTIEYTRKSLDLLAQQIDAGKLDNMMKRLELAYKQPQLQAQLDYLSAITGKTKAETKSIIELLPYQIKQYGADIAYKNAMSSLCEKQGILVTSQASKTDQETVLLFHQQETEQAKKNLYEQQERESKASTYRSEQEGRKAEADANWSNTVGYLDRAAKTLGTVITLGLLE